MSKLMGRWVRPDGGYVLEIRQVRGDGRLDAAYLNPRPIFISRAEAAMEPEGLRVRVELQDVGYPGCRYTLVYHPTNDVLAGEYYQAAIQESFDVVFTRMP